MNNDNKQKTATISFNQKIKVNNKITDMSLIYLHKTDEISIHVDDDFAILNMTELISILRNAGKCISHWEI